MAPISKQIYAEFRRLFWEARKELLKAGKQATAEGPAYRAADVFATRNEIAVGKSFLQAGLDHFCGEANAALARIEDTIPSTPPDLMGIAQFLYGSVLSHLKRYAEAEVAYRKALDTPEDVHPGMAWNNLGIVYAGQKKYAEAEAAYRKALSTPGDIHPGMAWHNLGLVYRDQEQFTEAEAAFRNSLQDEDVGGVHESARRQLTLLESKLKPEQLSPTDRLSATPHSTTDKPPSAEDRIANKLKTAGEDQYRKYMDKPWTDRGDLFSVLRGWSSAVTLIEGSEQLWRGGGYFFKWRGSGVVIDPGFDFLRNFHDAGFHAKEIHAVLVSHNHPDHNADLTHIDDLRYEVYKRRHRTDKTEDPDARRPFVVMWDADTARGTTFAVGTPAHRHEEITFDRGRCRPEDTIQSIHDLPLSVRYFRVYHSEDVPHSMGFVVTLLDEKQQPALRIGYTGDTKYFPDLAVRLKGCDILIAHMSQPDPEELADASKRKKVHLGYRGVIDLINATDAHLYLIGEFWAGLADLRIDLVRGLKTHCPNRTILPAGLGLHLRLPRLDVECTSCKKPTPVGGIRIAPPPSSFGELAYLCDGCFLG